MVNKKTKPSKIVYIVITAIIAVCLISFTVGREFYTEKSQSILSFGLLHFSGYLFFLLMPVEMAFIYYLSFYQEIELIGVAMGTAVVAQIIDYRIGYLISSKKVSSLVGEKRIEKAENYIQKYGTLTIFIFNLFPFSSPVIALAAGMLKFNFKHFILYSSIGLLLKYFVLSLIF